MTEHDFFTHASFVLAILYSMFAAVVVHSRKAHQASGKPFVRAVCLTIIPSGLCASIVIAWRGMGSPSALTAAVVLAILVVSAIALMRETSSARPSSED